VFLVQGGGRGPVAALYDIPLGRLVSCTVVRDCARGLVAEEGKKGEKWSIECNRILVIGDLDLRVVIGVKIDFQQFSRGFFLSSFIS